MDSLERWNRLQQLLNALPNRVIVLPTNDAENVVHISIRPGTGTEVLKFPLRQLNDLWTFVSNNAKPSIEFLRYLNTELSALKFEERFRIASLSERMLSTRMNGLNLKVNIPNSLTRMLLATIDAIDYTNYRNTNTAVLGQNHSLSVVIQIPELDPRHVAKADLLQLVPSARQSLYHDHEVNQFAVKLNFSETVFEGVVNDTQVLVALVIVLKCYPLQWHQNFFWDAWLAVTIQLCLSAKLGPDKVTFPCVWMTQVFDAERLVVSPEQVRHLLFGKDPVSKTCTYDLNRLCRATGIAFHAVGDDNPSIEGMKTRYGLNCDGDNPKQYIRDGLLMINLIRCIGENDESLNRNSCRGAWIAYTLKMIHHFSCKHKPVMVFTTASSVLPEIYIPAVCSGDIVRVPHPSSPGTEGTPEHQQNIIKVHEYLNGYYSHRPSNSYSSRIPPAFDHPPDTGNSRLPWIESGMTVSPLTNHQYLPRSTLLLNHNWQEFPQFPHANMIYNSYHQDYSEMNFLHNRYGHPLQHQDYSEMDFRHMHNRYGHPLQRRCHYNMPTPRCRYSPYITY